IPVLVVPPSLYGVPIHGAIALRRRRSSSVMVPTGAGIVAAGDAGFAVVVPFDAVVAAGLGAGLAGVDFDPVDLADVDRPAAPSAASALRCSSAAARSSACCARISGSMRRADLNARVHRSSASFDVVTAEPFTA